MLLAAAPASVAAQPQPEDAAVENKKDKQKKKKKKKKKDKQKKKKKKGKAAVECALSEVAMEVDFPGQHLYVQLIPGAPPVDLWGGSSEVVFGRESNVVFRIDPLGSETVTGWVQTDKGRFDLRWDGSEATVQMPAPTRGQIELYFQEGTQKSKDKVHMPMPKLVLKPTETCPDPKSW